MVSQFVDHLHLTGVRFSSSYVIVYWLKCKKFNVYLISIIYSRPLLDYLYVYVILLGFLSFIMFTHDVIIIKIFPFLVYFGPSPPARTELGVHDLSFIYADDLSGVHDSRTVCQQAGLCKQYELPSCVLLVAHTLHLVGWTNQLLMECMIDDSANRCQAWNPRKLLYCNCHF